MSNSRWQSHRVQIFIYLAGISLVASLFLTPLGSYLKEANIQKSNKIIGVVSGSIHPNGPWVEASKWARHSGIEVRLMLSYFDDTQVSEPVVQDFIIPKASDGHTYLNNNMTNIAFVNVDEDEWSEIVIPFFEENLIPRLYVLKYDPIIRQFVRVNDRD